MRRLSWLRNAGGTRRRPVRRLVGGGRPVTVAAARARHAGSDGTPRVRQVIEVDSLPGVGGAAGWWRVKAPGPSASPASEQTHDDESALPFWALMTFTFVLLIAPQAFI